MVRPSKTSLVVCLRLAVIVLLFPTPPSLAYTYLQTPATRRSSIIRHPHGFQHGPAESEGRSCSNTHLFSSSLPSLTSNGFDELKDLAARFTREAKEIGACLAIVLSSLLLDNEKVNAEEIVKVCDQIDDERRDATAQNEGLGIGSDLGERAGSNDNRLDLIVTRKLHLRTRALTFQRYEYLSKLMQRDYNAYVATATFISPSRIPRRELPNLQDVPRDKNAAVPSKSPFPSSTSEEGTVLVADCDLDDMIYNDSLLDKLLLSIFRKLVTQNTGGITSDKPGIEGLLEQGRTFMLQPGQTPGGQHQMVSDTLGGLMTPVLPPFYRVFMSGIVPKLGTDLDGKQFGPWFYAPFLTSFVTPTFFGFLVGPSHPNRRKDGRLGGLVVEKCKFLQESGCKGLCLHQCKLPAQQFFQQELGLPLTVSPNFVTQECQWSFGETPVPPNEDPSFPRGCLVGCASRRAIAASGSNADLCI